MRGWRRGREADHAHPVSKGSNRRGVLPGAGRGLAERETIAAMRFLSFGRSEPKINVGRGARSQSRVIRRSHRNRAVKALEVVARSVHEILTPSDANGDPTSRKVSDS